MTFAIDLRDLRYFEVIAELQHVSKAAAQLHRTQPALTSAVRRLEAACGMPLFERSGRGIQLTSAGSVLLKWAQRLRLDLRDAQREIGDLGRGLSGHVRIGIVPTAAQFLLPDAMRALLAEAPELTVKVVIGLIDSLRPMLQAGELDLAVGSEVDVDEGLQSLVLAEDQIVVAASSQHEILRSAPTMKDLTRYRWVLQTPGAPTRDWLDHAFDRRHLPRPTVQVESSMLLMLPTLIARTGLLSFVSRRHLEQDPQGAGLREVRLRETTMRRRLVASYRNSSYLSPAAERLIAHLAAAGERGLEV